MKKGKRVIFLIIIFMLIVGFIFINNKTDFVSKIKDEVEEEKNSDNKNKEEVKNHSIVRSSYLLIFFLKRISDLLIR